MSGLGLGIGVGTNVVGGALQAIAAQQARSAMEGEFMRELERQEKFRNRGVNVLTPEIVSRGVENARKLIAEGSAGREAAYGQVGGIPLSRYYKGTAADNARLKMLGALRAQLGGYGDWQNEAGIGRLHTQQNLNQIFQRALGQAQLFPYRMDDAQHSQDALAFWGQLISSLGGAAGNWASLYGTNTNLTPPPQTQDPGERQY